MASVENLLDDLKFEKEKPVIKAIDTKAVHQICSGQVILSLANAVKELLENSLDAKSTSIEIRLKDYGAESVEVIDNGVGIQATDFTALTLKHYTSKLAHFEDLVGVATYGFRGEALSSLCALGEVTIATRHREIAVGTKLEFDRDGKIIKQVMVPRQIGTTVSVRNLFGSLPVRHKEFIRNIKKEFSKMLNCVYGYCLICESIKILCSNQTQKSKSVLISSNQNCSVKERISSIFGHKQANNLLEIATFLPSAEIMGEYNLKDSDIEKSQVSVRGFISSCGHGSGRSSADRQFYFINKRPCELPRLSKLVNAVYHSYNRHQFPFVMMDISLRKDFVDVNVTPDKRSLFLDQEKVLLALVKSSLKCIYDSDPGILECSITSVNETAIAGFNQKNSLTNEEDCPSKKLTSLEDHVELENSQVTSPVMKEKREFCGVGQLLSGFKRKSINSTSTEGTPKKKSGSLHDYFHQIAKGQSVISEPVVRDNEKKVTSLFTPTKATLSEVESSSLKNLPGYCYKSLKKEDHDCDLNHVDSDCIVEDNLQHSSSKTWLISNRLTKVVPFSIEFLRKCYKVNNEANMTTVCCRKFKAKIEPTLNELAENELKKELTKEMFKKMLIIGQFNLGFIITKCEGDLFIIDQHASDEKYNFEDLKKNDILETQKLIIPRPLNLSAANEILLCDNLDIFRKNGFIFSNMDESHESGQQPRLVGVPISKNWTFGKEDIEEMLFMMSDGVNTGEMYRPSRIQQMLASRACRKSVMIGTALNASLMQKLVSHMAEMDQPWNCPHGRPTIRHLVNIDSIQMLK